MPDPSDPPPSALKAAQADAESRVDALTVSEIRYRRLFEMARDGILILNSETGRITDANPFMAELLGYSQDEFLGKELWEIGLLKDKETSQEAFRQLQQDGYIRYEDLPLENRRGEQREVEFVSNLYRENGHTVIQCNIRDITERKAGEQALAAAAAKNERIAETLQSSMLQESPEGKFSGIEVKTLYQAALNESDVGGDFFDAFVQATPPCLSIGSRLETKLGGNHHLPMKGREGFADKLFVHERAVDLVGVKERDAPFHGGSNQRDHLLPVREGGVGKTHPHGAKPQGRDFQVTVSESALLHCVAPSDPLKQVVYGSRSLIQKSAVGHPLFIMPCEYGRSLWYSRYGIIDRDSGHGACADRPRLRPSTQGHKEESAMVLSRKKMALLLGAIAITPAVIFSVATKTRGSDHADTPTIAKTPGADLTDVFVFPSPTNPNNVVLVMDVHPLIPTGMSAGVSFDPDVLYQFKVDNVGDNVEHLVIQMKATGTGPNQVIAVAGPMAPAKTGTQSVLLVQNGLTTGTINQTFSPQPGIKVFAGAREDPFFFDLNQFFKILPDRGSPLFPALATSSPNTPQATTFNGFPGTPAASDFLAGYNVLSIVVELPKSQLIGSGGGKIGVWCTTSK